MKILNGCPVYGSAMGTQQIESFLIGSKLNLRLGTIDESGEPNVHPVWFLYENGKFYIDTLRNSKKASNAGHNDTVYFCIDDESYPYRGVRGKGTAKIISNSALYKQVSEKLLIKYTGSLDSNIAKSLLECETNDDPILIEITPKYYSSWTLEKK